MMGMYIGILTYRPRRLSPPYFLRQPLPPPPACLASPPPTASLPSPHLVFPSSPYPAQIHQSDQLLTEETLTLLPHCHFPILQLLPSLHSHPQNFRSSRILITPSSQESTLDPSWRTHVSETKPVPTNPPNLPKQSNGDCTIS